MLVMCSQLCRIEKLKSSLSDVWPQASSQGQWDVALEKFIYEQVDC